MKKGDFGFYGEGLDGYVHYKQAFDASCQHDTTVSSDQTDYPDADPTAEQPLAISKPTPAPQYEMHKRRPGEMSGWQIFEGLIVSLALIGLILLIGQCS